MTWQAHLTGRRIEQARFLLDVAKMHPAKVAHRLGVTEDALNKILGRGGDGKPDPDRSTPTRASEGLR